MRLCGGIDLHSNNSYVAMVNEDNQVIFKNRCRNDLPVIVSALTPFKDELEAIHAATTRSFNASDRVQVSTADTPVSQPVISDR